MTRPASAPTPTPTTDTAAFWYVVSALRPYAALLLLVASVGAVAGASWRLTRASEWRAEASFIPVISGNASGLAGVAAQLGFNMPTADPMQSPAVYVETLRSRAFLQRLIAAEGGEIALGKALHIADADAGQHLEALLIALRDAIEISADPKTNVVMLAVRTTDAALSLRLTERALQLAQSMNVERRRARYAAERTFATARRVAADSVLSAADVAMRNFKLANRGSTNAPRLEAEQLRLERGVFQAQQVVQALRQFEEQSRLDEARDTPMFTLVQPAYGAGVPEGRKTALFAVLSAVLMAGSLGSVILLRGVVRSRSMNAVVASTATAATAAATTGREVDRAA